MTEFRTSPGMRDILDPESGRWRRFVSAFEHTVEPAGYRQFIPPLLEDIGVFQRVGEATDVVTKEMYDFVDKGERHVALRPEQTASVCRAFVQHRPVTPWKAWYSGPNFRYEKPQRGRFRQFDQVGIEVLGATDPFLDVEVIALGWNFLAGLGLRRLTLQINSLGEPADREKFMSALSVHFTSNLKALSAESRITLTKNPLRVLDSKRDEDHAIIASAPRIADFHSEQARSHFASVRDGLERLGIPFVVNERLVRGLDYYRHTTFEYVGGTLDSAQNALGGGGRYDGLVEDLGGPPTPGIGFAIGVDRTLLACDDEGVFGAPPTSVQVFVIDTTGGAEALVLTDELRRSGISADRAFESRSMKSQMKAADRSGAAVALIIGSDELASGTVVVRPLRGGEQVSVSRAEVLPTLQKVLT
ncbi:MAG: histidine--tRNA ligase [Actinomycetota bacterium]